MGFSVVGYADDLTVLSHNGKKLTKEVILAIRMRIKFWNFQVNAKKVRRFKVRTANNLDSVGLKINLKNHTAEPLNYRQQLRKLSYFVDLFQKGMRFTHRMNKQNENIQIIQMVQGLHNWLDEATRRFPLRRKRKLFMRLSSKVKQAWYTHKAEQKAHKASTIYNYIITQNLEIIQPGL